MQTCFAAWVEEYSLPLLKWAMNKTCSRTEAEDLTQEVWLQFFSTLQKEAQSGRTIQQPEHLLWKIARYVWCKHLRTLTARQTLPLEDARALEDFADALALEQERQQLAAWLHQRIVNLSRIQREAFILYYIEQVPQKEIARRLELSDSTLRWHLFQTRRRIKEEANHMTTTEFVYRPRTLHVGINGQDVHNSAVTRVRESLLMQNICCACYDAGRTIPELADILGVASPYIEHDMEWLVAQELLTQEKGRYYTAFLISTSAQEDAIYRVFEQHKATLCDAITGHLLAHEANIRRIGFIGCERPMSKLLWLLIYLFTRRLPLPCETPEPPYRPDGGKYWPLGFDRSDPVPDSPRLDFAYNGSMCNDGFYWFGLHDFGQSEIEDMMDAWTPEYKTLRTLLEKLIHAGFDPGTVTEAEKFTLAQLAEKGFVSLHGGTIKPNFVIFTKTQYDVLFQTIFAPLAEALQPELAALARDLHELSLSQLPEHLSHLMLLARAIALHDVGYTTELLAFRDGTLYHPVSKRDGEFLTMAYILR